jgi:hypothetical protein
LADLRGQATPFRDGQRRGDAAQGDLYGDVVTADDEQRAHRGVVASLVALVVVDELDVEVELAGVFGFGTA